MSSPDRIFDVRRTDALRTRYVPSTRMRRGFVRIAPWIDAMLLLMFFVLLSHQYVLQPGVVVDLPQAGFRDGSLPGMVAVVIAVPGSQPNSFEEIAFFDDERFVLRSSDDKERLRKAMRRQARVHTESDLVIQSDARIAHGTIVELMNMAVEVGVSRVNLATREP